MKHVYLFLIGCIVPFVAQAQYFNTAGLSADSARRAGIYSPLTASANDSLALNPAGLTSLVAPTVDLSFSVIAARGSFSNASNNDSPMASNNAFIPFGAFGMPLGRHWAVGVGVAPDLLSASKWHYSDTPGFAGTTYGPQAEKSQIIAFRGSAGLAYRFSERWSAGASFGADYNANTLDAPYIFQSNPALAGLKTLLDLHSTGYGYNGSFGIMAQPNRRLNISASFRTPTSIESHGAATGNLGAEFQTLGLAAPPEFGYRATVHVELPPSAILSLGFQATHQTRLFFQSDWTGWRSSFNNLPVTLTQGTNADINNLLQSTGIQDKVPLAWKDQYTFHGAIERSIGEQFGLSAGYLHANNPVPNSTLSPLTAAIMHNSVSAGFGWNVSKIRISAAYTYDLDARQQVAESGLLYDEYSNSRTKIGLQSFTLSTAFRPF